MAETTDQSGSTPDSTGGESFTDKALGFLMEPLGLAFVAGLAIAGFLAWRVF